MRKLKRFKPEVVEQSVIRALHYIVQKKIRGVFDADKDKSTHRKIQLLMDEFNKYPELVEQGKPDIETLSKIVVLTILPKSEVLNFVKYLNECTQNLFTLEEIIDIKAK